MRTRTSTAGKPTDPQSGFAYLGLLLALFMLAAIAESVRVPRLLLARRDREEELLFRGQAYVRAIRSYVRGPGGTGSYPMHLEDLVLDPRSVHRRHLRALYSDPITGGDWVLIRARDGGIAGVVSSSTEEPLKMSNFPIGLEKFEKAMSYSEWVFVDPLAK